MQLDELERVLRQYVDVDIGAELDRFHRETGTRELDGFVGYLCQRGIITGQVLRELHARDRIAVARFMGLRPDGSIVLGARSEAGSRLAAPEARPGEQPAPSRWPTHPDQGADWPTSSGLATMTLDPGGAQDETAPPSGLDTTRSRATLVGKASRNPPEPATYRPISQPSDHYAMLGQIGQGAMGAVFVAQDHELLRKVAFKQLSASSTRHPDLAARFFNEAQVTAQLDHPNVVPIYQFEVGRDGSMGYAMKLVQGNTLAAVIDAAAESARDGDQRAEATRLVERLEIYLKVCDAMAYAHSKGVLHRDLKPANIMVGRFSEVYVMDWGICRVMGVPQDQRFDGAGAGEPSIAGSPHANQTAEGTVVGTPRYMAPEQAGGAELEPDPTSDLYALGLILFELCALRKAIAGDTVHEVLYHASCGMKRPLRHIHSGLSIPRELDGIVARATAVSREQRYASVDQLAADVRAFLRGDAVAARPDTALQALMRWFGRHKAATLLVMAFLLLFAAGATIGVLIHKESELSRARHREDRVQALLLAVSRRSHAVDSYFSLYERRLARLAGRTREVLAWAEVGDQRIYYSRHYDSRGRAPRDLARSRHYQRDISIEHPVFKLAPGVKPASVSDDVQRMRHLAYALREIMLTPVTGDLDTARFSPTLLRQIIADSGVPVLRAFLTLQSGVHMSYPGMGGFPPHYDARSGPKYQLALHKRGIQWGNPFIDRYGYGLILPASTAVYDDSERLLGVAGIEMTFHWLIENLLELPDAPYAVASYLVDGEGNAIIQTAALEGRGAPAAEPERPPDDVALELEPLPYAAVRQAMAARQAGHVSFTHHGRAHIAAFYPLDTLDWFYVVLADEARLLAPAPAGGGASAGRPPR